MILSLIISTEPSETSLNGILFTKHLITFIENDYICQNKVKIRGFTKGVLCIFFSCQRREIDIRLKIQIKIFEIRKYYVWYFAMWDIYTYMYTYIRICIYVRMYACRSIPWQTEKTPPFL